MSNPRQIIRWSAAPASGRAQSLIPALRQLRTEKPQHALIVETGTLRDRTARESDGWSSLLFAWYAAETDSEFWTIDIDQKALDLCREMTSPYASHVRMHAGDSVTRLAEFACEMPGRIDFLYLDSVDYQDRALSEAHCLAEARAALEALGPHAVVVIDDTVFVARPSVWTTPQYEGKGAAAVPFLVENGFQVVASCQRQVTLRRKTSLSVSHLPFASVARKLRILWASNAPWVASGYGVQTKLFVPRLRSLGHDVAIHCIYGLEGGEIEWNGIPCFPRGAHLWGQDIMGSHALRFEADFVIFLLDAWVLEPSLLPKGVHVVPWFPVDAEPMPAGVFQKIAAFPKRLVFSRFAEAQARAAGLDVDYVPHGVDMKVMSPVARDVARDAVGLPQDAFIVGMVAANRGNPSRKAFAQCLEAFAALRKRHQDARLYLHTHPGKPMDPMSIDLPGLAAELGILDSVTFAPQYSLSTSIGDAHMAHLYSAFDVLLSPSFGEGFGVPIIEAQSCGCPVIVGDWTAMSELCFSGIKIAKSDSDRFRPALGGFQYVPRVGAIVEAIENIRRSGARTQEQIALTRMATMAYDADAVTESFWQPALSRLAAWTEGG